MLSSRKFTVSPGEIIEYNIDDWIHFGFDNYNKELLTKNWIVKASRSTAEVANLKQFYTPEIRKELSKLLHRIEYDVDREENIARLHKFCEEHMNFEDYLIDFIEQVVVHREVMTSVLHM